MILIDSWGELAILSGASLVTVDLLLIFEKGHKCLLISGKAIANTTDSRHSRVFFELTGNQIHVV